MSCVISFAEAKKKKEVADFAENLHLDFKKLDEYQLSVRGIKDVLALSHKVICFNSLYSKHLRSVSLCNKEDLVFKAACERYNCELLGNIIRLNFRNGCFYDVYLKADDLSLSATALKCLNAECRTNDAREKTLTLTFECFLDCVS